jgi:predicted secreted protein
VAEVKLTGGESGATRDVKVGDEVVVVLDDPAPTSGFRWDIEDAPANLERAGDEFEAAPNSRIGGGGTRTFRFRVSAPGSGRIALRRWRSWEGEGSVADRFDATIDAAP